MGFLPVSMRGEGVGEARCGRLRSKAQCAPLLANQRKHVQAKLKKSKAAKRELEAMIKEQAAVAPLTAHPC